MKGFPIPRSGTPRAFLAALLAVLCVHGCGAKRTVDRTRYIEYKAVRTRMILDGQSDDAFYRRTGLSRTEWTALEDRHRFDHDAVVLAGEKVRLARGQTDPKDVLAPKATWSAIPPARQAARSKRRVLARARYIRLKSMHTRFVLDGRPETDFFRETGLTLEDWRKMETTYKDDHDAIREASEEARRARLGKKLI